MEVFSFLGSKNISGPELDLFNLPPTNISTVTAEYQKILPSASVKDNNGPIEFRITRSNSFLDLKDSFLYIKARIKNQDGSKLLETDKIAPGNLFLHTLFQDVRIKFNDRTVMSSDGLYAYQAWIRNLLKVSFGAKESELSKEIYYKDTDPDDFSAKNTGFQKRLALAAEGKQFEMIGKISDYIFDQQRLIPNTVDVDIQLTRSSPNFCLSTETPGLENSYRVEIEDISFYVKRRVLEQDIYKTIQQKFSKEKSAAYPVAKLQMRTAGIQKGSLDYNNLSIFNGPLPQSICLGIVSSQAFNGKLNMSPFNFKNNNLSKLVITVNGQPVLYKSLDCNFKNGEYLLAYNTLFGGQISTTGNGISMEDYLHGNTLYVFDFGNSLPNQLQGETTGTIGIEIVFSDPLEENQNLVVLAQFQQLIEVDKNGKVEVVF